MHFELTVIKKEQGVTKLDLDAYSNEAAVSQAESQGYRVLSIKSKSVLSDGLFKLKSQFNLLLFSQELISLLKAGLSLVEAIETLADKNKNVDNKAVITGIKNSLYEGKSFSACVESYSSIFPAIFVALIKSSEKTGDMVNILERYVSYRLQVDALKKKVVTASIYPILLLVVGGFVTLFLLGFVVPRFSSVYESTNANLPMMTRLLIDWGTFVNAHSAVAGVALIVFFIVVLYLFSLQSVRSWLIRTVSRIDFVDENLRTFQLSRFYRTLGMLVQGGIPFVTSLQMASQVLDNDLKKRLDTVIVQVKEGASIATTFEANHLTTAVSSRMISIGEKSGQMGEMLERASAFYDDEITRAVDVFSRLFEPILMTLIGLVIGVIVVLMYMPIFDLADSIQ